VVVSQKSASLFLVLILSAAVAHADQQDRQPPEQGEGTRRQIDCESLPEKTRRATEACKTEEERREDEYQKLVAQRLEKEKPTKTSFLKWLHVDGLWAPTTIGAGTFGLVGTHVTIANVGRVNFFGPPGLMLLLENRDGGRTIRPAMTWGISVYLTDFKPLGSDHTAQLFLNLAKAQTFGAGRAGMDLAGLSITWKK
jgi:hypothetical protein